MSIQSIASELESEGIGNHVVIAKSDNIARWEKRLEARVGKPAAGKHFEVSSQTGGYRLELVKDPHGGAADVSPRLQAAAFEDWLGAFIAGYEFAKTGRI